MAMFDGLFRSWRKRRALAGYVRVLPRQLRRDYGPAERYTPAQVRASIDRSKLDRAFSCYAEALYTDADAFAADHAERGEACDYAAMRAEVSARHLGGHDVSTPGEAFFTSEAVHSGGGIPGHHGCWVSDGGSHGGFDGGHCGHGGH